MNKTRKKAILFCILVAVLVIVLTLVLLPYFEQLAEPAYQEKIQVWVDKMGVVGLLTILEVQILQVVIAFIPSEPVEILAGVLYGTIGGIVICLTGCIIASIFIFVLSKHFGKRLLYFLFREKNVQNWRWLQDSSKCELVTFLLFLVPGTPKDMLTYVVGITEMGTGKFILLTMLARIPSILSSTMIGSSMWQGEWELFIVVFLITGVIGIVGITLKDRVVRFCRKEVRRETKTYTKCECLDFVEAAHRNRVYPVMYCHMEIEGKFDIEKLKNAVQISSEYIPEILYAYDFKRNRFVNRGFTLENVIQRDIFHFEDYPVWDLSSQPQLKIIVLRGEESKIIFCMSHILSDGAGFLQYLYLVTALYNGNCLEELKNNRDISGLLQGIYVQSRTEQTKYAKLKTVEPLQPHSVGRVYYLVKSTISSEDFKRLHRKAKQYHVTLNDVFMTAYARVIGKIQHRNQVVIPCPADLRRFQKMDDRDLTVANMTGMYRDITINCAPQYDFTTILLQLHIEMELQKSRFRCFKGIQILNRCYRIIPNFILEKIIRAMYRLPSVSYTNIGVIEHEKLFFQECNIKECMITGSYRQSPDFQLTVSSFNNICTLNCTLIGDEETKIAAEKILSLVTAELLEWADNN